MLTSSANFAVVLRHRHFRNLWLGQIVANIGNYFYFLALLISVNELTGSTLAMSLMTISFALPQLVFGMAAGVYVDRWDRRRVMILSDVLRGALVLLCLLVHDPQQVWIYYVVGFAHGVLGSFFNPARDAVIPNLVEPDELLAANSLTQATQSASMLLGPAVAGFLIDAYGIAPAFLINAGTFLASALAILTIPPQRAAHSAPAAGLSAVWREMRDGLAVIAGSRTVSGLVVMLSIVLLGFGAVNVLWVPFMDRAFGLGPKWLGIMDSVQGVGMLLGSVVVGNLAGRFRKGRLMAFSIAALGITIAGIGAAPSVGFIMAILLIFGFFLPPAQAAGATLVQMSVPNDKLGRVNAALNTAVTTASLISMGVAGVAGDAIGIRTVFLICGAITLLAAAVGAWMIEEPRLPERPEPVVSALPGISTEG